MFLHRNAKLGLAGRFALVSAVEGGASLRSAAAAFNVSPATAHRWWHRWLAAGEEARSTLSCLFDRSSRPRRSPRQLAPELAEAICDCRRKTGWGPRLVAGATGFATRPSGRCSSGPGSRGRPAAARAGQQLRVALPRRSAAHGHKRVRALLRPGHRVTGDRSSQDRHHRDGIDFVHAIVDDHSRLAYAEIHQDQRNYVGRTARRSRRPASPGARRPRGPRGGRTRAPRA